MLLVQKIFYFHFATWMALTAAVGVCGVASAIYLFKGTAAADRFAVAVGRARGVFGAFGLVSGSLWGRKAWGVWWQWDARLTMAFMLELIFLGYLLVRKYGGPGSEKLAAAMGIFGAATAPFVYKSVDWWRTIHPQTSVMKTLGDKFPAAWNLVWFCSGGVSAAVCRPARRARAARRAARRARPALSGGRGVTMVRRMRVSALCAVAGGARPRRRRVLSRSPRQDGFVPVTGLPPERAAAGRAARRRRVRVLPGADGRSTCGRSGAASARSKPRCGRSSAGRRERRPRRGDSRSLHLHPVGPAGRAS